MRMSKVLVVVMLIIGVLAIHHLSFAKERQAEVTVKVDLKAPSESKDVRLWIPYPVSDENQMISDVKIEGNYTKSGVFKEKIYGNNALYAEWTKPGPERKLIFSFKVKRKEISEKDFPQKEARLDKNKFNKYLRGTNLAPIHGTVKEIAENITKDKKTILSKARALYDYIVDNWERDPNVQGCGPGDVLTLLDKKKGKCADIHSVYVAFAKSVGIPAREIFGIRIPKGKEGNMTKAQHCWAEFYFSGYGWVPVDPSDVLKYILEKKIKKDDAKEQREYYFGAVDESRIAYGIGRDVMLNPKQKSGELNFFMYPHAEVDGKAMDCMATEDFRYTISYKEL